MKVKIGDKFRKQLGKGKWAECEVVDIIERVSVLTGKVVGLEFWAKCTSGNYGISGSSFEVSPTTVLRNKI